MKLNVPDHNKYPSALVEYLDEGRLRPGLVIREQGQQVVLLEPGGREHPVARDLVLLAHPELKASRENLAEVVAALKAERERLGAELDLNLLWEVVREQGRGFTAEELAELFFGKRIPSATSVMLEALLNDRLYFVRRHMEFVARGAEQVERLRVQYDRIRLRSEAGRKTRDLIRAILEDGAVPPPSETETLITELTRYLENPFTRNRDLTSMIEASVTEMSPAEAAYGMLERLGRAPAGPRFALIGGLRNEFSPTANAEARAVVAPPRTDGADTAAVTIDDDDTIEVDDALSCEPLADGSLQVRIHIALVADFVARGGAMDKEAAARAATVYLPEATIRMLPDRVSCDAASLIAGQERHVMTTDVRLSASGDLSGYSIYPAQIRVATRLSYDSADAFISGSAVQSQAPEALTVRRLYEAAMRLRERRRSAGALLIQRRETKIKVTDNQVEVTIIDNSSPSRQLVAEFMVLSNHVAARYATENRIPLIYRVQPISGGELANQRPRLSLYPEYHAGIGLDCYAQLSSPIRRYMDLVLQRQLLAVLADNGQPSYQAEELLTILANSENAEVDGRELERRAKRYWILRYLEGHALNRPLEAIALRDGASAELDAYAVRGTLHGAPNLASQSHILVQIARLEPARGWLTFDYLGTVPEMTDSAT
ncbi:MAG: ribonuclease catalytic domain-containing protein [Candidatus Binataceae bacterium]